MYFFPSPSPPPPPCNGGANTTRSVPRGTVDQSSLTMSMPSNDVDPEETTALICKEMNELSLQERDHAYHDIHGVSECVDETPEFVESNLKQFNQEILNLVSFKAQNYPAYFLAYRISPNYPDNKQLRIQFLRAESFEPGKAAKRFLTFLELKLQWFGPNVLCRNILMSDLDAYDCAALESGSCQILPERDRSGRLVLWYSSIEPMPKPVNMLRMFFYLAMAAVEDDETQRRGIVAVVYSFNTIKFDNNQRTLHWDGTKLTLALPIRVSCIHFCIGNPVLRSLVSFSLLAAGKDMRARARTHEGTATEVQYSLLSFGIPVHVSPLSVDGELKAKNHRQWINKRKGKDLAPDDYAYNNKVDLPARFDVLLGKGKPIQAHPGNIRFQYFVDSNAERYKKSGRMMKKQIVLELMAVIKSWPSRFLQKDEDGWWVEVSDEMAYQKISSRCRLAPSQKIVNSAPALDMSVSDPQCDCCVLCSFGNHTHGSDKKFRVL